LYRCLKTCRKIIDGFASKIYKNTIFVETAVEERFSSKYSGIDENWRDLIRFYNIDKYQEFKDEIFEGFDYSHNALFDYQNNIELTAKFEETYDSSLKRLTHVINGLGNKFKEGEFQRKKMLFVIVTHGWVLETINKDYYYHGIAEGLFVDYCSFNLVRISENIYPES